MRWRCSPAARRWRRERGLILVDTKYEFGIDADGNIILADEIHTPDSSRYWFAESYPQRFAAGERAAELRQGLRPQLGGRALRSLQGRDPGDPRRGELDAARIYIEAYETITGTTFPLPDPGRPVLDRIRANLRPYF